MKESGFEGLTEDCSISEIDEETVIVSNVDIFTPIHDDPVIQGKITACNATNDIFALNVRNIISYLSFLGVPDDQPEQVTTGIITGQRQFLQEFGWDVNGGHSIRNPYPLMGGIAIGMAKKDELIRKQIPDNVESGVLIITKPIGLQAAMATYRVLKEQPDFLNDFDPSMMMNAIELATQMMIMSNYNVVRAIHEEKLKPYVASMTDITGFGLKEHSAEMIEGVSFDISIETMPVIVGTKELSDWFGYDLTGGCAAETAGPMLIAIETSKIDPEEFQRVLRQYNIKSWNIGDFKPGSGRVTISDDVNIINVDQY